MKQTIVKLSFEEAGLRVNKAKCVFMTSKVEFLGYIIDRGLYPT